MRPDELDAAVSEFCANLPANSALNGSDACFVDPATLASLMAEIDDPALRRTLLRLCITVVEADRQGRRRLGLMRWRLRQQRHRRQHRRVR